MIRYAAGGLAVLLALLAAFIFMRADADAVGPATPPAPPMTVEADDPLPAPPEATERTREQRRFDRYDKDRDDRITREEYLRSRRTAFAKLDRNGDGRLDFEEWAVRTTTKFAAADADRSNALTRAEFATTRPVRRAPPRMAAGRCDCGEGGSAD